MLACGAGLIRLNFFLKATHSGNVNIPEIALTFDDGPSDKTGDLLDLLKKYEAKGSFFCIGKQVEAFPHLAKRIVDEGHSIGNHSYNHENAFPTKSTVKMEAEIAATNEAIRVATGQVPIYFRPPFGVTNPRIARALKAFKLQVIGWNIRSLDTQSPSKSKIKTRVVDKLKPGSIVLLHDNLPDADLLLEQILKVSVEKKLKCVNLDTLMKNLNRT